MGRTAGINRPLQREDVDGSVSPQKETFPRRFPRLGSQFQTKLPKTSRPLLRELPERMSLEYPHLTETIVQQNEGFSENATTSNNSNNNTEATTTTTASSSSSASAVARGGFELPTRRGGRLLHTASDGMDAFPRYVQPLMSSLDYGPPPHVTDDIWKHHMVRLHNIEPPTTKKRSSNRAATRGISFKKRKRSFEADDTAALSSSKGSGVDSDGGGGGGSADDHLVWNLEDMVQKRAQQQQQHPHNNYTDAAMSTADDRCNNVTTSNGEDDACALEYIHQRHGGNMVAAKMNLLVDLSSGRATKVRKCIVKRQMKDKQKVPPFTSSDSWRKKYESMQFKPIFANFNEDPGPVQNDYAQRLSDFGISPPAESNLASDRDDLKGVWRSILACGKAMERQLEGAQTSNRKLLLSTIVSFISNAYGLPTPESCFGTHHVLIEEVSACMVKILDQVEKARQANAKLRDKLFSDSKDGIDSDHLLKFLDAESKLLTIKLDDASHLYESREVVVEWEKRATALIESHADEDDSSLELVTDELATAEDMIVEARSHGYVCKGVVQLKARTQKAYALRERIEKWKQCCSGEKKGTIKNVAGLVRESNRVKLIFPEVAELRAFHRDAEGWVDRANVAIRSRISLNEIEELIRRGEEMQLDLSDYIEKLRARVATAIEWRSELEDVVPIPSKPDGNADWLKWLQQVRTCLHDGMHGKLHDLASEGSRIPVEVVAVKLLQVELDAKNWTLKARKWIPQSEDSKKGKLEDLREHAYSACSLRERLVLPVHEKEAWILDGELELRGIVEAADSWYGKYKEFLVGDNRRNQSRSCLSMKTLRQIVDEVNGIHANLGNAAAKISRILAQADSWYGKYSTLVERCDAGLAGQTTTFLRCISMSDMAKAVASAESDISLDLDEALNLKRLAEKSKSWFERVDVAAPKRSKRQGRTTRSKLKIEDLTNLVQEASCLPVDTKDGVERLQMKLGSVEAWQQEAGNELVKVGACFDQLRERLCLGYGSPKEFSLDQKLNDDNEVAEEHSCDMNEDKMETESIPDSNGSPASDNMSTGESESDSDSKFLLDTKDANVHRLIKELQDGARLHGVVTREADATEILHSVSHWFIKSVKYLTCTRDIFDKRYFGAFDRFIKEGEEIAEISQTSWDNTFGKESWDTLGTRWGSAVQDQLERLFVLRAEREKFIDWCNLATQILNDDKKLTLEKLESLAEQSRCFPAVSDMVQKVRGFSVKAKTWSEKARKVLDSGKKLSLQDAKSLLEAGEKLKVNTQEVKTLKASLRAVRGWANRVKRCNLEQGSVHVGTVQALIAEHDSFLIEMPEELARLQSATQSYCVCRRPYSGFMIGCDDCDEWYHGQCIGISESRADKFDKFLCVRCLTKKVFKNSAASAVRIVRKWTSITEKKKARQVEYQRHQRKVRKEMKDIEKFRGEIEKVNKLLEIGYIETSTPNDNPCAKVTDEKKEETEATAGANEANEKKDENEATATISKKPLSSEDKEKFQAKLESTTKSILEAEQRLEVLRKEIAERKRLDNLEDWKADSIRRWCIRVRSLVLVPTRQELADNARPPPRGELSDPMLGLISDAQRLVLIGLPDVDAMVNCFKCLSWSMFALSMLRRKATLAELQLLLSKASSLKLPDEKPLRTIKVMASKANQWQAKVRKALAPKPGQTKPINVQLLKSLLAAVDETAVSVAGLLHLKNAIADKGARHCICGGPNYGGLMLCCDKCERWFHDSCVKTEKDANSPEKWLCAGCKGEEFRALPKDIESGKLIPGMSESATEKHVSNGYVDCSPHAPQPEKLWPPFGLKDGKDALEVLGQECASFPDEIGPLSPTPPVASTMNRPPPLPAVPDAKIQGKVPTQIPTSGIGTISKPAIPEPVKIPINGYMSLNGSQKTDGPSRPSSNGPSVAAVKRDFTSAETEQGSQPFSTKNNGGADFVRPASMPTQSAQIPNPVAQIPNPLHVSKIYAEPPTNERPKITLSGLGTPPNPLKAKIQARMHIEGGAVLCKPSQKNSSLDKQNDKMDMEKPDTGDCVTNLHATMKNEKLLSNPCDATKIDQTPTDPLSLVNAEISSTSMQVEVTSISRDVDDRSSVSSSKPASETTEPGVSSLGVANMNCNPAVAQPCISSKHGDEAMPSGETEQNATVTPSSCVQILDSEIERRDNIAGSEGADRRLGPDHCFERRIATGNADGAQPLTRPLADMRVALKEASA